MNKSEVCQSAGYAINKAASGDGWRAVHPSGGWVQGYAAKKVDAEALAWSDLVARDEVYVHRKGGVYRKLHNARCADGRPPVVVLEQLWPELSYLEVWDEAEFGSLDEFKSL